MNEKVLSLSTRLSKRTSTSHLVKRLSLSQLLHGKNCFIRIPVHIWHEFANWKCNFNFFIEPGYVHSSVVAVAIEGMVGLTGRWCVFLASRARYVHYYLADDWVVTAAAAVPDVTGAHLCTYTIHAKIVQSQILLLCVTSMLHRQRALMCTLAPLCWVAGPITCKKTNPKYARLTFNVE